MDELWRFFTNMNKPLILALCRPEKIKIELSINFESNIGVDTVNLNPIQERELKVKNNKNVKKILKEFDASIEGVSEITPK